MSHSIDTIVHPVGDRAAAKAVFTAALGTEPHTDEPYYVGFRVGDQEIGLDPNGHARGMTGPVPYATVTDIDAALEALAEAGAEVVEDPREVGGGRRIALLRDADGNPIGLLQD